MALTQISTSGIKDATIATADVANDAITSALIADDAVIQAAIAGNSVNEERIQISNAGTNGQYLQKQTGNTGGLTWADPTIVLADEDSDTTCFPLFATDATGTVAGGKTNADKLTFNASTGRLEASHVYTIASGGKIGAQGPASGGGLTDAAFLDNNGVTLSATSSGACELRFLGTTVNDYIAFKSDGSFSGTTTFVHPDGDGSANQVLKTDGSGNLDWTTITDTNTNVLAGGTITGDVIFDNATNAGDDLTWDMSDNALEFDDNVKATFGDGADLQIYHDSSHSRIKNTTGYLILQSSTGILLKNDTDDENFIVATDDGSVELCYDGTKKLETTTDGATVTGKFRVDISTTGTAGAGTAEGIFLRNTNETDNNSVTIFGGADDYSNAASAINFINTDHSANYGAISFDTRSSGGYSEKFRITDGGVQATGQLNFAAAADPNISLRDDGKIAFGNGDDFKIWHDGDDSHIDNNTSNLRINSNDIQLRDSAENLYIDCNNGGSVDLYHNGGKKFETTATGTTTTGKFYCEADEANGWVGQFWHQGNATDRYGVLIYCGADDASGTNYAMFISDGDGTTQGQISFTGGTVSYGAFTAHHPCVIPNSDNPSDDSRAYPYGTLLETVSIGYSQKNGANTERGIRYNVQKTQTANSKKVLGAYSSSMNGGPDNETNLHEVSVLGDGHILCNNSGGNISVGDGICSSSTAGIGQKATASPSMIIGIAQDDVTFTGTETKLVPVQYGLQQFTPW